MNEGMHEFVKSNSQQNCCLDGKRPILFFVLHPDNFSMEEVIALERSGLGYV